MRECKCVHDFMLPVQSVTWLSPNDRWRKAPANLEGQVGIDNRWMDQMFLDLLEATVK